VLSLVVGNGVAKLPDQFLSFLLRHPRLQPINDANVLRFCISISRRRLGHEFADAFHILAQQSRFVLILIRAAGILQKKKNLYTGRDTNPIRPYGSKWKLNRYCLANLINSQRKHSKMLTS
jgi:hypothetical protein